MKKQIAIAFALLATAIATALVLQFLADWPVPESYIGGMCAVILGWIAGDKS